MSFCTDSLYNVSAGNVGESMSEEVELSTLRVDVRSSIESCLASCRLPSFPDETCLVVSFKGRIEDSKPYESGYSYMHSMIGAGFAECNPATLILDIRELYYESGDQMCRILDQRIITKAIVSDLNSKAMSKLVSGTLFLDPSAELFESLPNALRACDSAYREFLRAGRKKIIAADF